MNVYDVLLINVRIISMTIQWQQLVLVFFVCEVPIPHLLPMKVAQANSGIYSIPSAAVSVQRNMVPMILTQTDKSSVYKDTNNSCV